MATTGATTRDGENRIVDRTVSVSQRARRLTTETKAAFKTTEFWAMIGLIVAILISAAAINGGDNGTDEFIARQAWLYVAILGGAYFISRGLAKSGTADPYDEDDRGRNERRR
jgi:di/tricarboxylate transporter